MSDLTDMIRDIAYMGARSCPVENDLARHLEREERIEDENLALSEALYNSLSNDPANMVEMLHDFYNGAIKAEELKKRLDRIALKALDAERMKAVDV